MKNKLTFFKYPSINNLDMKHVTNEIVGEEKWYAFEKIHGANYQFITNGTDIAVASRTQLLTPDNSFFNHQIVFDRYKNTILKIYQELLKKEKIKDGGQLRVFGELAGKYDNKLVQDSVDYGDLDFYMFDIFINEDPQPIQLMLEFSHLLKITPLIGEGLFKDIIQLKNEFPNSITKNSPCEGLVLKSESGKIYKHKNSLYREKNIETITFDGYINYINPNRMRAVITKFGEFDKSKMRQYIEDIKKDIEIDMAKDGQQPNFDKNTNMAIASCILKTFVYNVPTN